MNVTRHWVFGTSAVVMVACGSAESPDPAGNAGAAGSDDGAAASVDIGNAQVFYGSCDRTVEFEAFNITNAAGETVQNPECRWSISDGATVTGCVTTHQFATGGLYSAVLTVLDPQTGAEASVTTRTVQVYDDLSLEIFTDVPECGLTFDYTTVQTGGSSGWFIIIVEGDGNQHWLNPETRFSRSGQITMAQPGTYQLFAMVEEEDASRLCGADTRAEVTLKACPDPEPEPPECPPELAPDCAK